MSSIYPPEVTPIVAYPCWHIPQPNFRPTSKNQPPSANAHILLLWNRSHPSSTNCNCTCRFNHLPDKPIVAKFHHYHTTKLSSPVVPLESLSRPSLRGNYLFQILSAPACCRQQLSKIISPCYIVSLTSTPLLLSRLYRTSVLFSFASLDPVLYYLSFLRFRELWCVEDHTVFNTSGDTF